LLNRNMHAHGMPFAVYYTSVRQSFAMPGCIRKAAISPQGQPAMQQPLQRLQNNQPE
jgi:hypothetical protein